ncbi:hypothetical protein OEZ86_006664 [Tetradesmus obliquus]|nr:hypothetical protein OEZ86_006664 [Tetradesmus obliquus]
MREGGTAPSRARMEDQISFQHTQLGVYLAGAFGLVYLWSSSAQGFVDKYHFSKKWFYLYGALCCFAYLYMRPFVRKGLGSAHRGYVNFYSLYIVWLCSALFCHLPSFQTLGIDMKADVSLALSIAASSLLVLGLLHGLQLLAIHAKLLAPAPGATRQAVWSCIILNSITLAAACSTYFQLCGNGSVGSTGPLAGGSAGFLQDAVCMRYLAPIPTTEYPKFSRWMLSSLASLVGSLPGGAPEEHGTVISPVFTMWCTLIALYIINIIADHCAAHEMSADHISELRRDVVTDHDLALLAALSAAAGASLRQGAHQLAAAHQQRHQQQREQQQQARCASIGGWEGQRGGKERGRQRGGRRGRSGLGAAKRSKSLEMGRGDPPEPWSPRFMVERTMAQQRLGFGGFGSVVSLYSPSWENQGSADHLMELEELLAEGDSPAAAAAVEAATAAAAAGDSPAAAAAAAAAAARRIGKSSSGGGAGNSSGGGAANNSSTGSSSAAPKTGAKAGPLSLLKQAVGAGTRSQGGFEPSLAALPSASNNLPRTSDATTNASTADDDGSSPTEGGFGGFSGFAAKPRSGAGKGLARGSGSSGEGPTPPFLDMVPWYSGTSADLFKTMFDLMISLKLFLGRFDMRTMQAATAASMADSFNDTPAEGDGFTYEHFSSKQELWFDFIADTGDGGNPTYTVARALAAPSLTVPASEAITSSGSSQQQQQGSLQLPRGDVLLIGGDLAYPNPSRETYESRLFVPFQEAMPPPPHYHPGRLVVHKPDLPPSFGVQEGLAAGCGAGCPAGLSPRASRYASVAALRAYPGPNVFAIPGNHDWIDGLETFIKQIMHKGWLGGWLMPQEKSYFALRLPAGWWVFGLDLALVGDIDMCQYRYFANVVERRVGLHDNVIIITHEPTWLLEWFWASSSSSNLRQLVRGHLRGRARVHLAGDLHFYMRHSYVHQTQQQQQQQQQADAAGHQQQQQQQQRGVVQQSLLDPEHLIVQGLGGAFLHPTHVFSYSRFACLEDEAAAATAATYSTGAAGGARRLGSGPLSGSSSNSSLAAAAAAAHPGLGMGHKLGAAAGSSSSSHGYAAAAAGAYRQHPAAYGGAWEPEMLSWHCPMSPSGMSDTWELPQQHWSAAAAAAGDHGMTAGATAAATGGYGSGAVPHQGAAAGVSGAAAGGGGGGRGGVYKCSALFPAADKSLKLGRKNLHLFRFKNSRFDVIGGAIYFLSIVSVLPRCSAGLVLLSAGSVADFIAIFAREFAACWYDILMQSYVSLAVTLLFFLITFGFAKGGGVGAVSGERQQLQQQQKRQREQALAGGQQNGSNSSNNGQKPAVTAGGAGSGSISAGAAAAASGPGASRPCGAPSKRRSPVVGPLVKLRTGGSSTQLLVALLHAGAHLSLAVVLLLLLELGVEVCIKYEHLGNDGLHSMYRWFEAYQEAHFPDPMGLRAMAHRWSLGLYPGVIQAAMVVYDIPEAVAVARNAVCAAPTVAAGFAGLSRLQLAAYYAGMLAYYWLLAIPAMGFVFGLYLYVCVCWFHVHYDEAFSALRIANFKGLTRLHITKEGDLEIFSLGIERVPTAWREDSRWYSAKGGGGRVASHAAAYPSRWVPATPTGGADAGGDDALFDGGDGQNLGGGSSGGEPGGMGSAGGGGGGKGGVLPDDPSQGLRVVDYLKVPRQRPGLSTL